MLPAEADEYAKQIVNNEMPTGMECYLKLELFTQIHLKFRKGISPTTAQNWMHHNAFQYQSYKSCVFQ